MFRTSAKYVFLMDLVRLWILLTWIGNNASLAANSCREAGKCCPGRDSSCVAQKAQINAIIEDLSDQPCYCDHACLKLGDCCHDFKETCHGKLHTPILF